MGEPAGSTRTRRRATGGHLPRRLGDRRRLVLLACLASYAGLGVLANLPAWIDGPSRTVQAAAQGDIGQEVWFLAWVPAAIAHGVDPLVSGWLNVPWGVNLMNNTAMPVAGLVGAPITLLFGPIATYNVLFSFAFASSAAAAFLVLRRWTTWTPAAYLGGLVFGCSPYMVAQGLGHLFLVLVPILPAMLWCLDEIVVRQRRSPLAIGALLGLCAGIELGLAIELLAWAAVMAVIGLAGLAVFYRRSVAERVAHAARAFASALVVFAVIAAFPLYIFFAGPSHVRGTVHPAQILTGLSADLTSVVVPTSNQRISVGLAAQGDRLVTLEDGPSLPEPAESGSYVGLPLLLLLVAGAIRFRRDRTLRFALAMAFAAFVLSLGSHLKVGGHVTGVPLPFALLARVGVIGSGIASRFSLFMWLFLAFALAVLLDRAHAARLDRPTATGPVLRRYARPTALALFLAAGLAALLPAWPYTFGPAFVPAWFVSPAERTVPAGSTLLTYPMARSAFVLGMVWQALDDFRYRIPAGEASVTDPHGSWLEHLSYACLLGQPARPVGPPLAHQLQVELRVRRVDTIVVPRAIAGSTCVLPYFDAAVGRPPVLEADAWVWRGVLASLKP